MKPWWRIWIQRLSPAPVAAIIVPVILLAVGERFTYAEFLRQFAIALLYSFLIGGPMAAIVPPVWNRSESWNVFVRWLARGVLIAAISGFGCLMAGLCQVAAWGNHFDFWRSFSNSYRMSLLLSTVIVGILVTYERVKDQLHVTRAQLDEKELERQRALQTATAARLASLESRVHPHFLFNTINSVSALIHEDPARAEKILNQLAELLRFSLDSAQGGIVPLEREIKIVSDYLEIEKARFCDRLRYRIDIPPALGSIGVPPLAIQSLVENAVKYAVGPRIQGATIRVTGQRNDQAIRIDVADDGPGFSAAAIPTGHGLHNLEERLQALFGEGGTIQIDSSSAGTVVTLSIPAQAAKAA